MGGFLRYMAASASDRACSAESTPPIWRAPQVSDTRDLAAPRTKRERPTRHQARRRGLGLGGLEVGVLQEHGELVAADPPDRVGFAHLRQQPLGHGDQHRIAGGVAEAVVHALEVVQVEVDHAGRRAVPARQGDGPLHLADEGSAVEQGRQHVVVGQALGLGQASAHGPELLAQGLDLLHQAQDFGIGDDMFGFRHEAAAL